MIDRALLYRRLFGRFTTGVAVVLGEDAGKVVGLTVNSLTSASLDPLLLLFCAHNQSQSAESFLRSGRFSLNVLAAHQEEVARHFSRTGREEVEVDCIRGKGFAWLAGSNAVFRCHLEATYPGGDHRIILGRVMDMLGPEECSHALLYHEGRYLHFEPQRHRKALWETNRP
jgi:flavin reductase (DIM6/NTAB) family NADH-FMN oxidoreductase RutF